MFSANRPNTVQTRVDRKFFLPYHVSLLVKILGLRSVFGEKRVANTCSVRLLLLDLCRRDAVGTIGRWGALPRQEYEARVQSVATRSGHEFPST